MGPLDLSSASVSAEPRWLRAEGCELLQRRRERSGSRARRVSGSSMGASFSVPQPRRLLGRRESAGVRAQGRRTPPWGDALRPPQLWPRCPARSRSAPGARDVLPCLAQPGSRGVCAAGGTRRGPPLLSGAPWGGAGARDPGPGGCRRGRGSVSAPARWGRCAGALPGLWSPGASRALPGAACRVLCRVRDLQALGRSRALG